MLPHILLSKADEYEKLGSYAMIGLPSVYEKRFGKKHTLRHKVRLRNFVYYRLS